MSKHKYIEFSIPENLTETVIDSHAHITELESYDEVIKSMSENKLGAIVVMAGKVDEIKKTRSIVSLHENLYFMAGLHPYYASEVTEEYLSYLKEVSTDKKFVGVGEIGLDYHLEEYDKALQKSAFIHQLELAKSLGVPVSLHIREAEEDALSIFKERKDLIENSGIVHCYSGSPSLMKEFIDLGFYISFSGSVTYKKQAELDEFKEEFKKLPRDKILIETDSPYLAPSPYRGRENEPKYVLRTAEFLADILQINVNEFASITRNNTKRLLKIK